ncbi:MAG: metallophosphoesterase [Opitutaceae bacterium]|nr:metallophosphoesterase [Opitutaceae bacterium]
MSSPPATRVEIRPGVWLDSRRALWLAQERLLIVADLHWGYATVHRARGHLFPIWGDDAIEAALHALTADYRPAEMIWLGDVVHAAEGTARAERFLAATPGVTVVAGNHDRRWRGAAVRTVRRAGYFFHHGDGSPDIPEGTVEVVGHHHPAVLLEDGAGGRIKLPALVAAERRLVLPAFSPWAGGSPWPACPDASEVRWAIAPSRIFALPHGRPAATLAAR